MSDELLRALRRRTEAAPGDLVLGGEYVAALQRAGLLREAWRETCRLSRAGCPASRFALAASAPRGLQDVPRVEWLEVPGGLTDALLLPDGGLALIGGQTSQQQVHTFDRDLRPRWRREVGGASGELHAWGPDLLLRDSHALRLLRGEDGQEGAGGRLELPWPIVALESLDGHALAVTVGTDHRYTPHLIDAVPELRLSWTGAPEVMIERQGLTADLALVQRYRPQQRPGVSSLFEVVALNAADGVQRWGEPGVLWRTDSLGIQMGRLIHEVGEVDPGDGQARWRGRANDCEEVLLNPDVALVRSWVSLEVRDRAAGTSRWRRESNPGTSLALARDMAYALSRDDSAQLVLLGLDLESGAELLEARLAPPRATRTRRVRLLPLEEGLLVVLGAEPEEDDPDHPSWVARLTRP